jgi:hypothetical protein
MIRWFKDIMTTHTLKGKLEASCDRNRAINRERELDAEKEYHIKMVETLMDIVDWTSITKEQRQEANSLLGESIKIIRTEHFSKGDKS